MSTDPAELNAGRALAQSLQLEPLALEGGRFRRTFTGGGISAILYMLIGSDFSAMHRLGSDEVYFHHQGAPLRLLLIEPTGAAHEVVVAPPDARDTSTIPPSGGVSVPSAVARSKVVSVAVVIVLVYVA